MSRYLLTKTLAKANVILGRNGPPHRILNGSQPPRFSEISSNTLHRAASYSLNARLQKSTMAATATYDQSVDSFPSIVIGPDRAILPQGTFAEAQAEVCKFSSFDMACFLRLAMLDSHVIYVYHRFCSSFLILILKLLLR